MANTNQHLQHGKALCGAVFAGFVETFNALVDFMWNVKGDADFDNGEGHINIDRSNPLHPVIRFTQRNSGNDDQNSTEGLPIKGDAPTSVSNSDDQHIVAMRYDYEDTHQLQVKVRGVAYSDDKDRIVSVTPVSEWLMIDGGQCVEHQQGE